MEISVIIPTYKPDETLWKCLNSLERQTLRKDLFEVILILNGDKNPFYSNIDHYINNLDIQCVFLYVDEAGVSNARNIGINRSSGNYITFIDSDDFVSENYLENLLHLSVNEDCMAIANIKCYKDGIISTDYLGKCFKKLKTGKKYNHIQMRSYFSVPVGKLLPSEIVKKFIFDKELEKGEDGLFMFEIEPYLKKGKRTSDDTLYFRRLTEGSLSRKRRSNRDRLKNDYIRFKKYTKL